MVCFQAFDPSWYDWQGILQPQTPAGIKLSGKSKLFHLGSFLDNKAQPLHYLPNDSTSVTNPQKGLAQADCRDRMSSFPDLEDPIHRSPAKTSRNNVLESNWKYSCWTASKSVSGCFGWQSTFQAQMRYFCVQNDTDFSTFQEFATRNTKYLSQVSFYGPNS